MYLTPEQWLGCAVEARNAAHHLPRHAGELAAYAEECDLAAALAAIGHCPVVDPPLRLRCAESGPILGLIEGGGAVRRAKPAVAYQAPALRLVK